MKDYSIYKFTIKEILAKLSAEEYQAKREKLTAIFGGDKNYFSKKINLKLNANGGITIDKLIKIAEELGVTESELINPPYRALKLNKINCTKSVQQAA